MNNGNKSVWVALVVIGLIAIGAYFFPKVSGLLGGPSSMPHLTLETFSKGLQIGERGSKLVFREKGTCTLLANFSITASTTRSVSCAVTNARSGDVVTLNLAASTTLASQYLIKSSQASTTSGFVEAQLYNATGGSAVPAATNGFGSSTTYILERYQSGI